MSAFQERHDTFRANQARIYDNFSNAHSALGKSSILSGSIPNQGAFLIALRHPDEITEQAEAISLGVANLFPAITYRHANLHTTVSDYDLAPDLSIDPEKNKSHRTTLDSLCKIVRTGLKAVDHRTLSARNITFDRARANTSSVIAPGFGNDATLDIRQAILNASVGTDIKEGIGLSGAWGLHMTLNRFIGTSSLQQAGAIIDTLDESQKIGVSVPTRVDVGYLKVSEAGFSFTPYEQIDFAKFSGKT